MPFDRYLSFPDMYDESLDSHVNQPPGNILHIPHFLTTPTAGQLAMHGPWISDTGADRQSLPQSSNLPLGYPMSSSEQEGSVSQVAGMSTSQAHTDAAGSTTGQIPAALAHFNAPSALGLPVYSTSGFDLLPILARVALRPNPKVSLGPVDLSCSFAIVDPRLPDHPIVYVSPQFCRLTGYTEVECVGRNCRFLQAPPNVEVAAGSRRQYTDNDTVAHIKTSLAADKECQVSIVNYKKDGTAFINLITVIPITPGGDGEGANETVYQIGFQIDLTEQPNAILQRLQQGTYKTDTNTIFISPPQNGLRDRKANTIPTVRMSKQLRTLLQSQAFLDSLPISASSRACSPNTEVVSTDKDSENGSQTNNLLSLLLLDYAPDFVVVVSLKGLFLYVAPSVHRSLGYDADELVGQSLSDICHPADVVPLTRELKESSIMSNQPTSVSSATSYSLLAANSQSPHINGHPRPVDILFRARHKAGSYVWIECRGRLHIEPGKGRKAIILSGRSKPMESLPWSAFANDTLSLPNGSEFWGRITTDGGRITSVGTGVGAVLGYTAADLLGKQLMDFTDARGDIDRIIQTVLSGGQESAGMCLVFKKSNGLPVYIRLLVYHPTPTSGLPGSRPTSLIYHMALADGTQPTQPTRNLTEDVFAELQPDRTTSWQYELQQLRIENERLYAELKKLEDESNGAGDVNRPSNRYTIPQPSQQYTTGAGGSILNQVPYQYPSTDPQQPYHQQAPSFSPPDWGTPATVPMYYPQSQDPSSSQGNINM